MTSEVRQSYTQTRFNEAGWKARIISFLKRADISLHDIEVDEGSLIEDARFSQLPEAV